MSWGEPDEASAALESPDLPVAAACEEEEEEEVANWGMEEKEGGGDVADAAPRGGDDAMATIFALPFK